MDVFLLQVDLLNPLVSLEWSEHGTLPVEMQHAQAVLIGSKLYIGGGITTMACSKAELNLYLYDIKNSANVTAIPTPGPTRWSALATFHSQLVLAGGSIGMNEATDQLWVLEENGGSWEQPFSRMLKSCWGASAMSIGEQLIVAGGVEQIAMAGDVCAQSPLDTVQIYNVNSKQWLLAQSLPKCCYFMKTAFSDGVWYLAGGRYQGQEVFKASIESLITSTASDIQVWDQLPDAPRQCTSLAMYAHQLIAIGGGRAISPTHEIHLYKPELQSWMMIGNLLFACDSACSVVLPKEEQRAEEILLVAGSLDKLSESFSAVVCKATIKGR